MTPAIKKIKVAMSEERIRQLEAQLKAQETKLKAQETESKEQEAQLKAQLKAQEDKNSRLADENEKLKDNTIRLEVILSIGNGTPSAIVSKVLQRPIKHYIPKEDERRADCWKKLQGLASGIDLTTSENDVVHPFICLVLNEIYKDKIPPPAILNRVKPVGTNAVPDILICRTGVSSPSWKDVDILIKLKCAQTALMTDAIAQVSKYMSEALKEGFGKPNRRLIAMASNCLSLHVMQVDDDVRNLFRYELFELFPSGWTNLPDATLGFSLLYDLFREQLNETFAIRVNGEDVIVEGTIQNAEIGIYICTLHGEKCVVKQGITRRHKGLMIQEAINYSTVASNPELASFIVPKVDVKIEYGYAMKLAKPLKGVNLSKEGIISGMRHIFHGLRQMHSLGYTHLDIRPDNIVVYEETFRLIDWASLITNANERVFQYQGVTDPFCPSEVGEFLPTGKLKLWDLFCYGHTFLFLIADTEDRIKFHRPETRHEYIINLCKSNQNNIENRIARFFEGLNTWCHGESDVSISSYQAFEELLFDDI
jgi:hypothetical protein